MDDDSVSEPLLGPPNQPTETITETNKSANAGERCCMKLPKECPIWCFFLLMFCSTCLLRIISTFHYKYLPAVAVFRNFCIGVVQDFAIIILVVLFITALVYPKRSSVAWKVYRYIGTSLILIFYFWIVLVDLGDHFLLDRGLRTRDFGFIGHLRLLTSQKTLVLGFLGLFVMLLLTVTPSVIAANRLRLASWNKLVSQTKGYQIFCFVLVLIFCGVILGRCEVRTNPNAWWSIMSDKYTAIDMEGVEGCENVVIYNSTGTEVYSKNGLESNHLARRVLKFQGEKVLNINAKKPNIIMIIVESMRAEDFTQEVTPNFHRLKKEGYFFNNHRTTNPFTVGGYDSLLSGRIPLPTPTLDGACQPYATTITELATKAGYKSEFMTAVGKSRAEFTGDYDTDDCILKGGTDIYFGEYIQNYILPENQIDGWGTTDEILMEFAADSITNISTNGKPWLTILETIDLHEPYTWKNFSKQHYKQFPQARNDDHNHYLNILHYDDDITANLLAVLKARGVLENTVVIITGDHGMYFTDATVNRLLGKVTKQTTNVPFLLVSDQLEEKGTTSNVLSSHVDLMPTLADLFGLPEEGFVMTGPGRSLLRKDNPSKPYRAFACHDTSIAMFENSYVFAVINNEFMVFDRKDGDLKHDIRRKLDKNMTQRSEHTLRCVYKKYYQDYLLKHKNNITESLPDVPRGKWYSADESGHYLHAVV